MKKDNHSIVEFNWLTFSADKDYMLCHYCKQPAGVDSILVVTDTIPHKKVMMNFVCPKCFDFHINYHLGIGE